MTQDNYCIACGQVSEIFSDNFRGVFIGGNLVAVWTSSLRSGGYASLQPWVQQWSLRRWCLRRWCFLSWDTNFRHESSKSFGRWCVAWKREEKMVNFSSKHAGFLSFPVVLMSTIRTFFGAIFLSNCPKFFPNKSGVIKQVTPPKFKQTTISWFFFSSKQAAGSNVGPNCRLLRIFNDWFRPGPPHVKIQQVPRIMVIRSPPKLSK